MHMLTKLAFYQQEKFFLFGINNSFALCEKDFLAHSLLRTLRSAKIGMRQHRKTEPNLLEYLLFR